MRYEHVCFVTVDNTRNPYSLTLLEIAHLHGTFDPPIAPGFVIAAGRRQVLRLDATELGYGADATLTWSTGPDAVTATIVTQFEDTILPPNVAMLTVRGSDAAKRAYGVSYFYASSDDRDGTEPMSRDHVPATGNPVRAVFAIVRNAFVDAPVIFLPGIERVVFVMLENRALDHLLGQVYTESRPPQAVFPPGGNPHFDGLGDVPTFRNWWHEWITAAPVPLHAECRYTTPDPDPGEEWEHVNTQLFHPRDHGAPPTMLGFAQDYATRTDDVAQIMQFHTPATLPVMSRLALLGALSDAWFCSVPTQTNANRAFSIAGTSSGLVDNENTAPFMMRTLFNVLSNAGDDDWAIYKQHSWFLEPCFTAYQFEALRPILHERNVLDVYDDFMTAARAGTLPAFSYVEPSWYFSVFGNGNDYHPPGDIGPGEQFLWDVYTALTSNAEAWKSTLLVITFDEHGGTFDHVPPPRTVAPDAESAKPQRFDFTRLGLRVPTILLSPHVRAGTVFRSPTSVPFDHTSFLKTILGWRGIDIRGGVLGSRAAVAPDFSGIVAVSPVQGVEAFVPRPVVAPCDKSRPLNGRQKAMAGAWAHAITGTRGDDAHRRVKAEIEALPSVEALEAYMECLPQRRSAE